MSEQRKESDLSIEAALRAYQHGRVTPGVDGRPDHPKSAAEVFALWENLWTACDFSWEGISDIGGERRELNFAQRLKRWAAPVTFPKDVQIITERGCQFKYVSLQDYWRWSLGILENGSSAELLSDRELIDKGFLIQRKGRLFHIAHGEKSKITPELQELILVRLKYFNAPEFDCDHLDRRLQLVGWRASGYSKLLHECDAQSDAALHINASIGNFAGLRARNLKFGNDSHFSYSYFGDSAQFSATEMGSKVNFDSAAFDSGASFFNSRFQGPVSFNQASFGPDADFMQAEFASRVSFVEATFGYRARFVEAVFLSGATFSRASFADGANLAEIGSSARFDDARFGNGVSFNQCTFTGRASFLNVSFGDGVSFHKSSFQRDAYWRNSVFRGAADFSNVSWHADVYYGGAFDGARFEDIANFKTRNFSAYALFYDVTFKQGVLLAAPVDGMRPQDIFNCACRSVEIYLAEEKSNLKHDSSETPEDAFKRISITVRVLSDQVWRQLSGGYRVAKKAMEASGDIGRAQTFYQFEIKARLKQPHEKWSIDKFFPFRIRRDPGISWFERIASRFYEIFSDYGASIGRPLVSLIGLIAFFSVIYFAAGGANALPPWKNEPPYIRIAPIDDEVWQAAEFSLGNAFRPFYLLSAKEPPRHEDGKCESCKLADRLLFHPNGVVRFSVKLLGIVQSFLSLVLAFLFGLGVRRKFQIS